METQHWHPSKPNLLVNGHFWVWLFSSVLLWPVFAILQFYKCELTFGWLTTLKCLCI